MLFPRVSLVTQNRQLYGNWIALIEKIRRTIECDTPTNATGKTIPIATIVGQTTTANQIAPSINSADSAKFTGVTEEAIANNSRGIVRYSGPVNVKFVTGLRIANGETAFVGGTPGYATNDARVAPGATVRPIGTILDASGYNMDLGGTCKVLLSPNADVIAPVDGN